jgi:CheY-like chemotaxis protein
MKILLVEDDYLQEEAIVVAIRKEFPQIQVEILNTELEFRQALDRIAAEPPDLIILDVMMRWTDPSPEMVPQPDEVKEGKYYRAGIRCEKLLRTRPETKRIPVIFYSILELKDLGIDLPLVDGLVFYLPKGSDPEPLFNTIRGLAR